MRLRTLLIFMTFAACFALMSCSALKRDPKKANPIIPLILKTSKSHTGEFKNQKEYENDRRVALDSLSPSLNYGDTLFFIETFNDSGEEYDCTVYYSFEQFPEYYIMQKLNGSQRNLVIGRYAKGVTKTVIPKEVKAIRRDKMEEEIARIPHEFNPNTHIVVMVTLLDSGYSLKYYSYMGDLSE